MAWAGVAGDAAQIVDIESKHGQTVRLKRGGTAQYLAKEGVAFFGIRTG